jgi:hypothetical protein
MDVQLIVDGVDVDFNEIRICSTDGLEHGKVALYLW